MVRANATVRTSSSNPQNTDCLWAITSYFNPVGYRHRLANYRIFRERLGVPLVTVELGYHSDFELADGDADVLVQLRGTDVMWQKERLLNIALTALPESCSKVAWVDCDIIFENSEWPKQASVLLDRALLLQLFSEVHYMPRDLPPTSIDPLIAEARRTSLAYAVASGLSPLDCLEDANHRVYGLYSPGFAWAARTEFIKRHNFYDGCIVGGGDRAMVSASYGCFEHVIRRHRMIDREVSRYMAWAQPYCQAVEGAINFVEGNLFHLWHGALDNRRMRERHQGLSRFQFDPSEDIAVDKNGAWRWNSDKPEMHDFVRDRFALRREDG